MTKDDLKRLANEVAVTFNHALTETIKLFGDKANERGIQLLRNYEKSFKKEFIELGQELASKMRNSSNFDEHKLATIGLSATLISRPITGRSQGHSLNEIAGFFLAVYILRDYQLDRICGDNKELRAKLISHINEFVVPEPISSHRGVRFDIILSLPFLSNQLRASRPSHSDFLRVVSVLMFYIDSFSFISIKKIAKSLDIEPPDDE